METLQPVIEAYLGQHGWAVQVLSIMATLRLLFKPTQAYLKEIILLTSSKRDDELLARFESSKTFRVISTMLDLFASIKLPSKP